MREIQSQYRELNKDIVVTLNRTDTPWVNVPHLHSSYEIYYNISGAKGFMVNGEFYRCGERDLIVVPEVQSHKVIVKKNVPYERCIINISDYTLELLNIMCGTAKELVWLRNSGEKPQCVNLSGMQHGTFIGLIEKYNSEEKNENHIGAFSVFVNILSFLKSCFENPRRTEYMDENELTYADKLMSVIEKNFKNTTAADIADKIFINEDYANRVFREETGITLKTYLTMRKIAEAKKYLYLGRSAKEACVLSGFRDYANFLRTFKNYEGYSPGRLDELSEPL